VRCAGQARGGSRRRASAVLGLLLVATASGCAERVSVSSTGEQANGGTETDIRPAISKGGRFVTFVSAATNLVPGDTNGVPDVFVRDRRERVTERVNVSSTGAQANHISLNALGMSPGGRFVAFISLASNLVSDEASGTGKVYLHDRSTGATERISRPGFVDAAGRFGLAVSAGGRFVAFDDQGNQVPTPQPTEVFVRDRATGNLEKVDVDSSEQPFTAPDGTRLDGFAPAMSSDGRFVAFIVVAEPRGGPTTRPVGVDVVLRDRQSGTSTILRRVSSLAEQVPPSISADGRFVASQELLAYEPGRLEPLLASFGVRIHDRVTGSSRLIAPASGESLRYPSLSPDGRFLAMRRGPDSFLSPAVSQIVVRNLVTDAEEVVSENVSGGPGNGSSHRPATSTGGLFTAFTSFASNLTPGDSNGVPDAFVADLRVAAATP
jgi:Tol biopolymer transport system component